MPNSLAKEYIEARFKNMLEEALLEHSITSLVLLDGSLNLSEGYLYYFLIAILCFLFVPLTMGVGGIIETYVRGFYGKLYANCYFPLNVETIRFSLIRRLLLRRS